MNQPTTTVLRWLIMLAMPFFLAFAVITLVISPAYPRWAYSLDSFPPDPYGFSQEQRLDLALVAIDYLQQRGSPAETIYLLEEQIEPNTGNALYNEREIGHMIDVKRLTDLIRQLTSILGVVVIGGLGLLLWQARPQALRALRDGGLFGSGLLLVLALFIGVGWEVFFVRFHELLFPPDSWMFPLSDSLIRLFPEVFWFYVGIIISGTTLLLSIIVAIVGWFLVRRQQPAPRTQNSVAPQA